jgi:glycosyltransferase involved in cell wall biosynthesis
MNKRILFDGIATQGYFETPYHGGGEYAKFVLKKAIELGYRNFDIVFSKNKTSNVEIDQLLSGIDSINIYYINTKNELYTLIKKNRYDCFYSALPNDYTDYDLDVLFIMVIHGLRAIELPWDKYRYKYYSNLLQRLVAFIISESEFLQLFLKQKHVKSFNKIINKKTYKIITVSEHSKYAILNFFPFLKMENISVYDSPFNFTKNKSIINKKKDYYLLISANRYEKNIYRSIMCFNNLFLKGYLESKRVILVGCSDYHFFRKISNNSQFELLPYISQKELEELFSNAFAFVYPSLNEGFGYPPLTAMKYGVPVIASSATSIPEVCDNAAIYFDPRSIDDFMNRILQVNYNDVLYNNLINKGFQRIKELENRHEHQFVNMIKVIFD